MNARKETARRSPKIHMASLGCVKNLVDSERLLGRLASAGGLVGAAAEEADVIIINTCGFIDPAKRESIETIREYSSLKGKRPGTKLLVMGCLVQRSAEELRAALPEVDGFFRIDEQNAVVEACGLSGDPAEKGRLLLTPKHTAYLQISDGCSNRCTYCTIPLIRGPFRSRPPDEILAEARDLAAFGVRELNLIGQDTTSYGKDLGPTLRIHQLLERISSIPKIRWIRLLYAHPAHFSDELVDAYGSLPNLVPYIDLPLQHLNDEILRRMGRRVKRDACLALIRRLRDRVPDIVLRTTFIVGFPGETEEQFSELLRGLEEIRFDHVGAFAYSPESGTPAADCRDPVPADVVEHRLNELMLTQQEIVFSAHRKQIGQEVELLVDGPTEEPGLWIGRTAGQAPDVDPATLIRAERLEPGDFLRAKIVDAEGYDLIAVPL